MKRFLPALLGAALITLSLGVLARADVSVGYPASYTLAQDLNVVGLSATLRGCPVGSTYNVNVYGTFTATIDVYTSANGTFINSDSTKVAKVTAATTSAITVPVTSSIVAVRAQNRAYTSGDPLVAVDCNTAGGQIVNAGEPEPTPSATP